MLPLGVPALQAVSALTFSPDGGFLYSGGEDAMVSSWNVLAAVDPEGAGSFKVLLLFIYLFEK